MDQCNHVWRITENMLFQKCDKCDKVRPFEPREPVIAKTCVNAAMPMCRETIKIGNQIYYADEIAKEINKNIYPDTMSLGY